MPHFIAGRDHLFRLGQIPAMGLALAGFMLAAWSAAIVALLVVPAAMFAFVTARAVRWLGSHQSRQAPGPLIIDGEYQVVDEENDTTDRGMRPNERN